MIFHYTLKKLNQMKNIRIWVCMIFAQRMSSLKIEISGAVGLDPSDFAGPAIAETFRHCYIKESANEWTPLAEQSDSIVHANGDCHICAWQCVPWAGVAVQRSSPHCGCQTAQTTRKPYSLDHWGRMLTMIPELRSTLTSGFHLQTIVFIIYI